MPEMHVYIMDATLKFFISRYTIITCFWNEFIHVSLTLTPLTTR